MLELTVCFKTALNEDVAKLPYQAQCVNPKMDILLKLGRMRSRVIMNISVKYSFTEVKYKIFIFLLIQKYI